MAEEHGRAGSDTAGAAPSVAKPSARARSFSLAQMLGDAGILPADQVAKAQEVA